MSKTREIMHNAFETVYAADRMADRYGELFDKIPTDKWVRCVDIDAENWEKVAKLFKGLCGIGAMERRVVDDGIVEIKVWAWVSSECNEPERIEVYDKDGNPMGTIANPKYRHGLGEYREVPKKVHAHHAEFRLLPLK